MTPPDLGPDDLGPDDLPLLGEPGPVELANSLYGIGDERLDFLATPALARLWLDHAGLPVPFPARLATDDVARLRRLRDAVHRLVGATIAGAPLPPSAVAELNRFAGLSPRVSHLEATTAGGAGSAGAAQGGVRVGWSTAARGVDAALGALAHDAVALLGGDDGARLRRCAAPDCTMAFVQRHRRRRWCHDSCGHRMRQAAYQRRRATTPGPTGRPAGGRTP